MLSLLVASRLPSEMNQASLRRERARPFQIAERRAVNTLWLAAAAA